MGSSGHYGLSPNVHGYTGDMRDQLIEAVQTAREAGTPRPTNEQETCFRIIDPLLKAMDYGVLDVKIQDRDNAGQKPDYTIMPDSGEATWFLEAKAWGVSLQDHHAQQAVNYANTQGKRWVVLTNGQEWRLYDNQAFGEISVKLACVARLADEDIVGLLEALSRTSIERGKLEDFARNTRLYNCLSSQIARTDSEVTKAVVKALRGMHGMSRVTPEDVVRFWRDYAAPSAAAPTLPPPAQPCEDQGAEGQVQTQLTRQAVASPAAIPLGSLDARQVTGNKPAGIVLSNGQSIAITKWNQVTIQSAVLALSSGWEPESPLYSSAKAKCPLLSRMEWQTQPMREGVTLPNPHNDWRVETHFSGINHIAASIRILSAAGIDPASVKVLVADRSATQPSP